MQYFKDVAEDHSLYRFVKLRHQVVHAGWHESEGTWKLRIKDLATDSIFEDWCHFMISGSGILNNWKWPDIPGLHSFEGQLLHTAAWDPSADWRDKTVAVLGCGSSGVQLVPAAQKTAKQVITFIRTPTWITAGFAQSKAGPNGANFEFSDERKQQFRDDPETYLQYRKEVEGELNQRFKFVIKDSPEQREALRYSTEEMKYKLDQDERLIKHLVPTFNVGCRRPTPGNGYLEALRADNVLVVTDRIECVVPEGIKLDTGEVLKVDMFVCATGFDISFCPRYPVIGRNGISLAQQWHKKPTAYLSLAAPNFPNHFSKHPTPP